MFDSFDVSISSFMFMVYMREFEYNFFTGSKSYKVKHYQWKDSNVSSGIDEVCPYLETTCYKKCDICYGTE